MNQRSVRASSTDFWKETKGIDYLQLLAFGNEPFTLFLKRLEGDRSKLVGWYAHCWDGPDLLTHNQANEKMQLNQ